MLIDKEYVTMSTIALNRNMYNTKASEAKMISKEAPAAAVKDSTSYIISGLLGMDGRTNAYPICSMLQER